MTFFWLNTLKGTAKAPTEDLLRQNSLTGNKTSKSYNEHPILFIWEASLPGLTSLLVFEPARLLRSLKKTLMEL